MGLLSVKTKYGQIQGVERPGCTLFKGIPYAKPPVGRLRFEAPQEPEAWEGCRMADQWPNRAMQESQTEGFYGKEFYSGAYYTDECSEDCLYLNIWTGAVSAEEKLPVAVWIHGGGYTAGYSWEPEFDGEAWAEKGVILVTVGYRLGVFGFLAHPELSKASGRGISGNYGILDQIAALKWVHENIGGFGGDSDNVTVSGQSAGAMSVQTLASSPLAKGLFQKAIIQSGGGYKGSLCTDYSLADAEECGAKVAALAGCTTAEELKSAPANDLLKAYSEYVTQMFMDLMAGKMPKTLLAMSPNVDQYVLVGGYRESIERGELPDIPYMIGSNADDIDAGEGSVPDAGSPGGKGGTLYHGAIRFAGKLEEMNQNPVYVYSFNHKLPGDDAGAFHSAELWYIFKTYGRCWRPFTEEDAVLSEEMAACWTNFVKTGSPNAADSEEWRACRKEDPFVKVFY